MTRARLNSEVDANIWALRCEGYTYEQIAENVGCHPTTVGVAIRRHRARLTAPTTPRKRSQRLSFDQVQDILRRLDNGETQSSIARSYGRHSSVISRICTATSYVHVPAPDA